MGYGHPGSYMWRKVVSEHVEGRKVLDLGAGDGSHSRALVRAGASEVVAADVLYHRFSDSMPAIPDVRVMLFNYNKDALQEAFDVIYLSYPVNRSSSSPKLLETLSTAPVIIYHGCNVGGCACGSPDLFKYLATREVLGCEVIENVTTIVYGPGPRTTGLVEEEWAALQTDVVRSIREARELMSRGS